MAEHSSGTEQLIIDALRSAGELTLSFVAIAEGLGVVGHVAVSPVNLSDGSQGWYGLGPVSVLPTCQGEGIGSQLIRHALDTLRKSRAQGCVVLGEPAFYKRFGFEPVATLVLADVPPEYFQALSFQEAVPSAVVRYHLGCIDISVEVYP